MCDVKLSALGNRPPSAAKSTPRLLWSFPQTATSPQHSLDPARGDDRSTGLGALELVACGRGLRRRWSPGTRAPACSCKSSARPDDQQRVLEVRPQHLEELGVLLFRDRALSLNKHPRRLGQDRGADQNAVFSEQLVDGAQKSAQQWMGKPIEKRRLVSRRDRRQPKRVQMTELMRRIGLV